MFDCIGKLAHAQGDSFLHLGSCRGNVIRGRLTLDARLLSDSRFACSRIFKSPYATKGGAGELDHQYGAMSILHLLELSVNGLAALPLRGDLRTRLKTALERGRFQRRIHFSPLADIGPKLPGQIPVHLAFDGMFEGPHSTRP